MAVEPAPLPSGIGLVAIGRNEGDRFRACLASIPSGVVAVYVDSGSTDTSVDNAEAAGLAVIHLSTDQGFTAARARNAGWRNLLQNHTDTRFIQFIDGDCALDPSWLGVAARALEADDTLAAVFGRRRERYPDRSLYNAQCDREWDVPIGPVRACGGDVLIRTTALVEAGGYTDGLIAGEEPDLCLRMRSKGWSIVRIDAEMTLHDAAILTFGTWWKRARRAGHAYAEHVWVHRHAADPDWVRALMSMALWAIALPCLAVAGLAIVLAGSMAGFALTAGIVLLYGLQFFRLWRRSLSLGLSRSDAAGEAALLLTAKFAHLAGAMTFLSNHLRGRNARLIEYK